MRAMKRIMRCARPLQKGGKNAAAHLPRRPGSNTAFSFTAGNNPSLDIPRSVIWREGNVRELLRDLPELLGGLLIACSARNPGNCGHSRQFCKAARTVVATTNSERAGRRIQGGKSPLRDLLPKTGDHPGDLHPEAFEEGGGASAKCRSGCLEIGQRGSRMGGVTAYSPARAQASAVQLHREHQGRQFGLPIGALWAVATLTLQIMKIDGASEIRQTAQGHHPRRTSLAQQRHESAGEREMSEVVGAQLQFEPIGGDMAGRWCHNARIVD